MDVEVTLSAREGVEEKVEHFHCDGFNVAAGGALVLFLIPKGKPVAEGMPPSPPPKGTVVSAYAPFCWLSAKEIDLEEQQGLARQLSAEANDE